MSLTKSRSDWGTAAEAEQVASKQSERATCIYIDVYVRYLRLWPTLQD